MHAREERRNAAIAQEQKAMLEEPAQPSPERWRSLLQQLSDLAIADADVRPELSREQIEHRWLGEPPATEEQILAAENRLGVRLPPSYRAFLKVSNGWHFPNQFVGRLAGTDDIAFTRDKDPELIKAWNEGYDAQGVKEATGKEWPESHLAETLLINDPSDFDDAANFMLNPATVRDGEMEAWFFSSWNPGASALPSFWHLMSNQAINWKHSLDSKRD